MRINSKIILSEITCSIKRFYYSTKVSTLEYRGQPDGIEAGTLNVVKLIDYPLNIPLVITGTVTYIIVAVVITVVKCFNHNLIHTDAADIRSC